MLLERATRLLTIILFYSLIISCLIRLDRYSWLNLCFLLLIWIPELIIRLKISGRLSIFIWRIFFIYSSSILILFLFFFNDVNEGARINKMDFVVILTLLSFPSFSITSFHFFKDEKMRDWGILAFLVISIWVVVLFDSHASKSFHWIQSIIGILLTIFVSFLLYYSWEDLWIKIEDLIQWEVENISEKGLKWLVTNSKVRIELREAAIKRIRKKSNLTYVLDKIQKPEVLIPMVLEQLDQHHGKPLLHSILLDQNRSDKVRVIAYEKLKQPNLWKSHELISQLPLTLLVDRIAKTKDMEFLIQMSKMDRLPTVIQYSAIKRLIELRATVFEDTEMLQLVLGNLWEESLENEDTQFILLIGRYLINAIGLQPENEYRPYLLKINPLIQWYSSHFLKVIEDRERLIEKNIDPKPLSCLDNEMTYTVCNLIELTVYPHAYEEILQKVWLLYREVIHVEFNDHASNNTENIYLELALGALLRAMAKCAAYDKSYTSFDEDIALNQKLAIKYNRLKKLIESFQNIAREKEQLYRYRLQIAQTLNISSVKIDGQQIHLKQLQDEIRSIQKEINSLEYKLSPAQALKSVVTDLQKYSNYIRQQAIIGLITIVNDSNLKVECKDELMGLLDRFKWSEVEEDLNSNSIENDSDSQIDLMNKLKALGGSLTIDNFNDFLSFYNLEQNNDKKGIDRPEFLIWLFPNSSVGEFYLALYRVLNVYLSLDFANTEHLLELCKELSQEIPEVLPFLEKFPLKLIDLSQKNEFFEYYYEEGLKLEYWTTFTPPKEEGEVHNRYYKILNFTLPNSRGINFNLFRDKVLLLPHIYHEFLHNSGVTNEAEVWLKQHLFLRKILLKYSRDSKVQLGNYISNKLNLFEVAEDSGSKMLLSMHLNDLHFYHFLNNKIREIYGEPLTELDATRKANKILKRFHAETFYNNAYLTWCPEIRWPDLFNHPIGYRISTEIKKIISVRSKQNNTISEEKFWEILNEKENKNTLQNWGKVQAEIDSKIVTVTNLGRRAFQNQL